MVLLGIQATWHSIKYHMLTVCSYLPSIPSVLLSLSSSITNRWWRLSFFSTGLQIHLDFFPSQSCNTTDGDFPNNKKRYGRLTCSNISALHKVSSAPCTTVKRHHNRDIIPFFWWSYKQQYFYVCKGIQA